MRARRGLGRLRGGYDGQRRRRLRFLGEQVLAADERELVGDHRRLAADALFTERRLGFPSRSGHRAEFDRVGDAAEVERFARDVPLQDRARAVLHAVRDPGVRRLAERVDRAVLVAEIGEHMRQQFVRFGARGIEFDELAGEALGAFRLASFQPQVDQRVVGLEMIGGQLEDALQDTRARFPVALAFQLGSGFGELGQRLGRESLLQQQFGDLQATRRVGRVETGHAPQQIERLALAAVALVGLGGGLQRDHRLGAETEPLVQIGERDVDVVALAVELRDLLVDRDGLGVETVACELIGDLQVRGDRFVGLAQAQLQVADLEPHVRIARIGVEQRLVVLERLVDGALLQILLRGLEHFSLVDCRQAAPQRPSRSGAHREAAEAAIPRRTYRASAASS